MVRKIQILQKLDCLIRYKQTESPHELAQKFRVTEKSIRTYINTLRKLGAPIYYSRKRKSYYYGKDGFFSFRFSNYESSMETQEVIKENI